MADPNIQHGWPEQSIKISSREGTRNQFGGSSQDVAHASGERSQGQGQSIQSFSQAQIINRQAIVSVSGGFREFWRVEPNVGRVANGVPNRVDRLKQLGNAVVPQIPELIGKAIMAKKDPHG
jgi:DNA (cytosine-5)-methyltransferase 1